MCLPKARPQDHAWVCLHLWRGLSLSGCWNSCKGTPPISTATYDRTLARVQQAGVQTARPALFSAAHLSTTSFSLGRWTQLATS